MGALTMGLNPLSKFQGVNAVTPKERTLAYDEKTGDIYSAHYVDGQWTWRSRTAEIQEFLDTLSASGIFTASAAFVNNRKILRFFYDPDNGVVRLNPDLRFDSSYRYYAIRSISRNADGAYEYVTGETSDDGNIIASLVNMDVVDSDTADGTQVSKPEVGKLYGEITDGNVYVVEFYDAFRNLINLDSYQAVKVRTADTDLCPDTAIENMYVHCNQQLDNNAGIYLYQGQNVDELEIQVQLAYGNNLLKDVTNELVNGGKLSISGLDEIDTSTLSGETGDYQTIIVSYQMIRSNASFASSSTYTPDDETVTNKTYISPQSNTIYKEIPVKIIASADKVLSSIIPSGYVVYDSDTAKFKMKLRFFAHYTDGTIYDVTKRVQYSEMFNEEGWGNPQELTIKVPYGAESLNYASATFSIQCPPNPADSEAVEDTTSQSYGRVTFVARGDNINEIEERQVTFNESDTAGGLHSGSLSNWSKKNNNGEYVVQSADELKGCSAANYGSRVANYYRVRDIEYPSYYYTLISSIDNNSVKYDNTPSHTIKSDTPLLVEFYQVITDSSTNSIVSTFCTGACVHYAQMATS